MFCFVLEKLLKVEQKCLVSLAGPKKQHYFVVAKMPKCVTSGFSKFSPTLSLCVHHNASHSFFPLISWNFSELRKLVRNNMCYKVLEIQQYQHEIIFFYIEHFLAIHIWIIMVCLYIICLCILRISLGNILHCKLLNNQKYHSLR